MLLQHMPISVLAFAKRVICCRTTIQQAMQSLDVAQELRQQVESSSLEYKTNVGTRIEAWLQQDIDSFTSYMRDVGNKQAEKWARSSKENMAVYLSRARPGMSGLTNSICAAVAKRQ